MFSTTPVGAARLDFLKDGEACVRTVAIHQEYQRRGFGRAIMAGLGERGHVTSSTRLCVRHRRALHGLEEERAASSSSAASFPGRRGRLALQTASCPRVAS
ncbi:GNAT family N-acetyltransferase [Rhizobium etli]|uniref:GNAT family N-acetyltransferase n=1 Tax=Rhizobium etli TaxID=29449 RepID=UPI0012BD3E65